MLQHSTSTFNNWTPSYFLGFLARIASIYLRTKHFVAESLDVLLLVLGGVGLPDRVLNIFKRMNVLTSKKIGDNPNVVLDILSGISEFFHHLIEKSSWVPQFLKNYLCKLFGDNYIDYLKKIPWDIITNVLPPNKNIHRFSPCFRTTTISHCKF